MKALLTILLATLSLSIQAKTITPPDGKITLYYEDGSKEVEKEYKKGQPIGTWNIWYKNGERWGSVTFKNTALPDYDYSSQIVKVEVRYPDEDNTLRYKGEQFALKLINTKNDDGSPLIMPMWDHTSQSYNKKGHPIEDGFVLKVTDDLTGKNYHFPSLYWQGLENPKK